MKKYKLEIWIFGYKSGEFETDNYDEIRRITIKYLKSDVGIKLFIDGIQIPYLKIKNELNINEFRDLT